MRGVLLAVMLAAAVLAGSQTDLYKVLELQRGAEEKEIKKAFRRLSSQWHPDVNREPEAKEKFIQIQRVEVVDSGLRGAHRQAEEAHIRYSWYAGSRRV